MDQASGHFIDILHGHLTPHAAIVYARVAGIPGGKQWSLAGQIRGPQCRHARTLPTTHALTDLGPGEQLMAEVNIPDPCFWSPDLPALYHLTLELRHENAVVQSVDLEIGLRFLGTKGNSLFLEGKRWVLRAIHQDAVRETPLEEWREAGAAMVVDHLREELFCETSREGVMVVATVVGARSGRVFLDLEANDSRQVTPDLRRVSQYASAGFLIAEDQNETAFNLKSLFPNTILVLTGDVVRSSVSAPWPAATILDVNKVGLEKVGELARSRAIIALRRIPGVRSFAEARAACDLLQRDLAPYGDCAGYIV